MRIQIASDLHLEHLEWRFPKYRGVEPTDADVLVLAGDIANGTRVDLETMDRLCKLFRCRIGDLFEFVEPNQSLIEGHGER